MNVWHAFATHLGSIQFRFLVCKSLGLRCYRQTTAICVTNNTHLFTAHMRHIASSNTCQSIRDSNQFSISFSNFQALFKRLHFQFSLFFFEFSYLTTQLIGSDETVARVLILSNREKFTLGRANSEHIHGQLTNKI